MKRHFRKLFLIPLGVALSPFLPVWLWMLLAIAGVGSLINRRLLVLLAVTLVLAEWACEAATYNAASASAADAQAASQFNF